MAPEVVQALQASVEEGLNKCKMESKPPDALFRDAQTKIDHKRTTVTNAADLVKGLEDDLEKGPLLAALQAQQNRRTPWPGHRWRKPWPRCPNSARVCFRALPSRLSCRAPLPPSSLSWTRLRI